MCLALAEEEKDNHREGRLVISDGVAVCWSSWLGLATHLFNLMISIAT